MSVPDHGEEGRGEPIELHEGHGTIELGPCTIERSLHRRRRRVAVDARIALHQRATQHVQVLAQFRWGVRARRRHPGCGAATLSLLAVDGRRPQHQQHRDAAPPCLGSPSGWRLARDVSLPESARDARPLAVLQYTSEARHGWAVTHGGRGRAARSMTRAAWLAVRVPALRETCCTPVWLLAASISRSPPRRSPSASRALGPLAGIRAGRRPGHRRCRALPNVAVRGDGRSVSRRPRDDHSLYRDARWQGRLCRLDARNSLSAPRPDRRACDPSPTRIDVSARPASR